MVEITYRDSEKKGQANVVGAELYKIDTTPHYEILTSAFIHLLAVLRMLANGGDKHYNCKILD